MSAARQATGAPQAGLTRTQLIGYALAGAACLAYGASLILAKQVVDDTPPLLGAALGMTFGMMVLAVVSAPDVRRDKGTRRRAWVWAALGGLAAGGGITCMFLAVSNAPVVVVAPILAMNPLTAILFSQIFIRGMERLTWRVLIGAVFVVAGVVIISLGQNT
ncbi:MAG: DMT family transporter [Chloroflexota bacterium]|nr:DMT family transporter [Chloroflexota bacterium]